LTGLIICFCCRIWRLCAVVLLGVGTMGDHIWGQYVPKTPQNGRE